MLVFRQIYKLLIKQLKRVDKRAQLEAEILKKLNLFLYDFLNVNKYSFLKSFKNYNNLINFYNKFIKNRNSWK